MKLQYTKVFDEDTGWGGSGKQSWGCAMHTSILMALGAYRQRPVGKGSFPD